MHVYRHQGGKHMPESVSGNWKCQSQQSRSGWHLRRSKFLQEQNNRSNKPHNANLAYPTTQVNHGAGKSNIGGALNLVGTTACAVGTTSPNKACNATIPSENTLHRPHTKVNLENQDGEDDGKLHIYVSSKTYWAAVPLYAAAACSGIASSVCDGHWRVKPSIHYSVHRLT